MIKRKFLGSFIAPSSGQGSTLHLNGYNEGLLCTNLMTASVLVVFKMRYFRDAMRHKSIYPSALLMCMCPSLPGSWQAPLTSCASRSMWRVSSWKKTFRTWTARSNTWTHYRAKPSCSGNTLRFCPLPCTEVCLSRNVVREIDEIVNYIWCLWIFL